MSEVENKSSFPVGFSQATEQFCLGQYKRGVTAACILFTDRIVLLLTSNGKMGQFLSVSTGQASLPQNELQTESDMSMLPDISLTPDWVLGSSDTARSHMASLLSVQVTSALMSQGMNANQKLLFGLNLPGEERFWQDNDGDENQQEKQEAFINLVKLAVRVYVHAKA
jgi:hypothetical protein